MPQLRTPTGLTVIALLFEALGWRWRLAQDHPRNWPNLVQWNRAHLRTGSLE